MENVIWATVGTVIFFVGVFLSIKYVKKYLNYEFWYFTHLLIYFAILLTFLHQISTGADFADKYWFTAFWYGLYAFVFLVWGWYRALRPISNFFKYHFEVESVKENGAGTYTVTITGKNIEKFAYKSGQYATWRIMSKSLWYEAHPFSLNSRPGQNFLQFTFKSTPKYADRAMKVLPGTRVFVDGPRGNFTIDRSGDDKNVVLIAGGIGLAPYISTIGPLLDIGKNVTLLYSVKTRDNISFADAISFYSRKGLKAQVYIDSENSKITDEILNQFAKPDTTVYICGPQGMSVAFANKLEKAGLPAKKIITERFSF
jgi:predicted ferric reductase